MPNPWARASKKKVPDKTRVVPRTSHKTVVFRMLFMNFIHYLLVAPPSGCTLQTINVAAAKVLETEGIPFVPLFSRGAATHGSPGRKPGGCRLAIFSEVVSNGVRIGVSNFCTSLCERSCTRNVTLNSPPGLGGVAAPSINAAKPP